MSLFKSVQSFAYSKENSDHFLDVDMQSSEACRKAMTNKSETFVQMWCIWQCDLSILMSFQMSKNWCHHCRSCFIVAVTRCRCTSLCKASKRRRRKTLSKITTFATKNKYLIKDFIFECNDRRAFIKTMFNSMSWNSTMMKQMFFLLLILTSSSSNYAWYNREWTWEKRILVSQSL